jgi:voltage-gated potassium channel
MMLLGWGILAVPTGIVTAELAAERFVGPAARGAGERACTRCGASGHSERAKFCDLCGTSLAP